MNILPSSALLVLCAAMSAFTHLIHAADPVHWMVHDFIDHKARCFRKIVRCIESQHALRPEFSTARDGDPAERNILRRSPKTYLSAITRLYPSAVHRGQDDFITV